MKVAMTTLLAYFEDVEDSLIYDVSNDCLEGLNNFIKVLKRIAFG